MLQLCESVTGVYGLGLSGRAAPVSRMTVFLNSYKGKHVSKPFAPCLLQQWWLFSKPAKKMTWYFY